MNTNLHLREINFRANKSDNYPYNLPLIKNLKSIKFESPVTFFVGENGSGKSTLLEGIAAAVNLPTVGSTDIQTDQTLDKIKEFSQNIMPVWSIKTKRGLFMRAEDFFGFVKSITQNKKELAELKDEYEEKFTGLAKALTTGSMISNINEIEKRYGENADGYSHGESFINLFKKRIVPNGLYILDEPEAPLSPTRQLSLITLIQDAVKNGCQFLIATHSPIILAVPGATIYTVIDGNIQKSKYQDVEHVSLTKTFLENPERFLKYL